MMLLQRRPRIPPSELCVSTDVLDQDTIELWFGGLHEGFSVSGVWLGLVAGLVQGYFPAEVHIERSEPLYTIRKSLPLP
jgi:hypothetical protein